jgi:hypothetical protein
MRPVSSAKGETMHKITRSAFVVGLAVVVLMALMATSTTAAPLSDRFHGTFSDTGDAVWCDIDGTIALNGMDNIQVLADGTFRDEFRLNIVFTSTATQKSVEYFVAAQQTFETAIFNGDGTVTFVATFKGIPEKVKVPGGPTLAIDVGNVTIIDTFDAATGDFISRVVSPENGPHPFLDGAADFCDVVVPALT